MNYLSIVPEDVEEVNSNSSRKPYRSLSPPVILLRSLDKIEGNTKRENETPNHESPNAAKKVISLSALLSKSHAKGFSVGNNENLGSVSPKSAYSLIAKSPKNGKFIDLSQDNLKSPVYRKKIVIPKISDIKRSLDNNRNKSVDNPNQPFKFELETTENDWQSISTAMNNDEEMENVKKLETWQYGILKDKASGTLLNTNEVSQKKSVKKVKEDQHFPNININVIRTIFSHSEEEEKNNKLFYPSQIGESSGPKKTLRLGEGSVQSLTNAIRETNQELLYELISRKIKDFFVKVDIEQMTNEQLKIHTKMIAESVFEQFKSLKGASNVILIQSHIEYIIGRLRTSKIANIDDLTGSLKSSNNRLKSKPIIVDYESQENTFVKSFEQAAKNIKELQEKLLDLNHKSLELNEGIKRFTKLLELTDEADKNIAEEAEKEKKNSLENSNRGSNSSIRQRVENNLLIRLRKARQEKRKTRLDLESRIQGMQSELSTVTQDIQTLEKELKSARNYKAHYRLELKELYYKMLKDDVTLLDINNTLNYTWTIRALWKMDEELKPHVFPNFLDQASINFLTNYVKLQEKLESHCQKNNLMFLIANSEEFKNRTNLIDANSKTEENREKSPSFIGNTLEDISTGVTQIKEKDLYSLLDKFKGKLATLKKVNLKAKKLTQVVFYNSKGKHVVPKWEDVDPTQDNDALSQNLDSQSQEGTLKNSEEKSVKFDVSTLRNGQSPIEKALQIINNLQKLREDEMNRLIKQNLSKEADEKQKLTMKKVFRFTFGRKQGEKAYYKWLKEQSSYAFLSLKQQNPYQQKTNDSEVTTPKKALNQTMYFTENQIWSSSRNNEYINASDQGIGSAGRMTFSTKFDIQEPESVFKLAGSKVITPKAI